MQYDRMLAELFGEEDRAREMATHLAEIARTSREAAAAERDSLLAFLRGPIERHFCYEEQLIFPELVDHGLGEEVQVATKQHDSVRQLAERLETAGPEDDLGALVFDIARLLLHHTNFEGDYIYPELTHDEWRELMKETASAEAAQVAQAGPTVTTAQAVPPGREASVPAGPSVIS
jgi:Hemerythrin HHE cation binding domain